MSQDKEREALNDDAIWEIAKQKCGMLFSDVLHMNKAQMAATVRAALASQQAGKGEPVAWMNDEGRVTSADLVKRYPEHKHEFHIPLYASPPSREPLTEWDIRGKLARLKCWHRLTEQEADELVQLAMQGGIHMREVEPQWQPIETAPMDGTVFLGFRDYKVREAHRVQRDDCEMWCFGSTSAAVEYAPEIKPTHWMPLPPPPGIHSRGEADKPSYSLDTDHGFMDRDRYGDKT